MCTQQPHILSGPWSFKFDRALGSDELAYITPLWVEQEQLPQPLQQVQKLLPGQTHVLLPLQGAYEQHSGFVAGVRECLAELSFMVNMRQLELLRVVDHGRGILRQVSIARTALDGVDEKSSSNSSSSSSGAEGGGGESTSIAASRSSGGSRNRNQNGTVAGMGDASGQSGDVAWGNVQSRLVKLSVQEQHLLQGQDLITPTVTPLAYNMLEALQETFMNPPAAPAAAAVQQQQQHQGKRFSASTALP